MNIIVEGPDGAGKSTLVDVLSRLLDMRVVHSPGPAKTAEEFNDRVRAYFHLDRVIFDRHPVVSERIYGTARGTVMTDPNLEVVFNCDPSILVYVKGDGTLADHRIKKHEDPEHIEFLRKKHAVICRLYDEWAMSRADIIYRKGEDKMKVFRFLKGALSCR